MISPANDVAAAPRARWSIATRRQAGFIELLRLTIYDVVTRARPVLLLAVDAASANASILMAIDAAAEGTPLRAA